MTAGSVLGRQWRTVGRYSDVLDVGSVAVTLVLVARFVWRRRDRLGA